MALAVLAAAAMVAELTQVTGQLTVCPLTVRLSTVPKPTGRNAGVTAGKRVTVTVKVKKSTRKVPLGQGGLAITLPPGLCVLKTQPSRAQIVPESGNVF